MYFSAAVQAFITTLFFCVQFKYSFFLEVLQLVEQRPTLNLMSEHLRVRVCLAKCVSIIWCLNVYVNMYTYNNIFHFACRSFNVIFVHPRIYLTHGI